jgi:hypothetical protein
MRDLSMPPFEQEKTNEKLTMSKKLEKLKIKHEEKKNCDQIVIMVQ